MAYHGKPISVFGTYSKVIQAGLDKSQAFTLRYAHHLLHVQELYILLKTYFHATFMKYIVRKGSTWTLNSGQGDREGVDVSPLLGWTF